jgi:hypothetical protein
MDGLAVCDAEAVGDLRRADQIVQVDLPSH